jgi:hypothetical protein
MASCCRFYSHRGCRSSDEIDVAGWASPFADQPQFNLKAGLTGLELPRFSSYAARMLGLNLETGPLNVDPVA